MPTFVLEAVGGRALHFRGADGRPDLRLSSRRRTRIGRAPDNDVRLPPDWVQISSKHCVLTYSEQEGQWLLEDLSTNGTFVNDARVARGSQAAVRVGDRVRLSIVDPKAPDNHLEYVLRRLETSPEAVASAAQSPPGEPAAAPPTDKPKRKHAAGADEGASVATANKRTRGEVPGFATAAPGDTRVSPAAASPAPGADVSLDALFQLRENNKKLVRQLETERAGHEKDVRRLRAEAEGARNDASAARAEAQQQARAAKERSREVEAELMALRSRGMQLQMEVEAERAAAGRASEQAAEAAAAAEAARAAADGRLAALEEQLAAAGREAERGVADAAAARAEADALRAALAAERQEKAGVVASLGAALADAQQARDQAAHLEARVVEERHAREGAQRAAEEDRGKLERALRKISTLQSRELLLQSDRVLVARCLDELQRGNDRSQAANQRISEAFARLQEAKREADAILEAQRQQCTDICAKLAASNALREQPSPAPGTAADTQDVPGLISPAGMPLTAPAVAVAAITPLAHAGVLDGQQEGRLQLVEEDVMEAEEEQDAAAHPEQQRQQEDADMDDAEDAAPHAVASPASAAAGRSEQRAGSGAASPPALAAEAAAGGDDAEVAVAGSAEQEAATEAAAAAAAAAFEATTAVLCAEAAVDGTEFMDSGVGFGDAGAPQVQEPTEAPGQDAGAQPGIGDVGGSSDATVSEGQDLAAAEDLAQQAEEQPDADAEHAGAEYSAGTTPQSSERSQSDDAAEEGEAGAVDGETEDQARQLPVAPEEAPPAEQAAAEDVPAPAAGEVPAADQAAAEPQFGLNALWGEADGEEEQRETAEAEEAVLGLEQHQAGATEQEAVVFEEAGEATRAEGPENDASQGNLAGGHEDRSLLGKAVPESDPQQQDSGAAAGPEPGWP